METETNYLTQDNISKYIDWLFELTENIGQKQDIEEIDEKRWNSLYFIAELEEKGYIKPVSAVLELGSALDPLLKTFLDLTEEDEEKAYEFMKMSGLPDFKDIFIPQQKWKVPQI